MHETQESMKMLWVFVVIGAVLGLGKLLASDEVLTVRLVIGRVLLGSGASTIAGVGLIWMPDLHPLALVAVSAALGIIGSAAIEAGLRKYFAAKLGLKRRSTDKQEKPE